MTNTTNATRRAIMSFLEKTGVAAHFPPRSPPQYVETKVREIIQSWELDISKDKYEKTIVTGLHLGCAPFRHVSDEFQIALSLFSFCVVVFDDATLVEPNTVREFVPRFCDRKAQLAPVHNCFVEAANDLRQFLHEYGANTAHSALLMFANEELRHAQHPKQLTMQPYAGGYIEYSRYKNGIPEPYAFGIWPRDICDNTEDYIQAIP